MTTRPSPVRRSIGRLILVAPITNDPRGPTADQIVAKVLGNAQGGSIVLMHLGGYETVEALPRIVQGLQAGGYDPVSLDQMLGG